MTHSGRSADTHRSDKPSHRSKVTPDRGTSSAAIESDRHPVLALQRTVGNRAVQRSLGITSSALHSGTRIQRHVAPATAAMGESLHSNLLVHYADLIIHGAKLQQAESELSTTAQDILDDSMNFLLYSVLAESHGSSGAAQSAAPATPAPTTSGGQTTVD